MTTDKAAVFAAYWGMLAPKDKPDPVCEFRFHEKRRWRFDFAWPSHKISVEVEGNAWNTRGGGRHMQDGDLQKYNTAAAMGWRVLRFSPGMLKRDPQSCIDIVLEALAQ